MKTLLTLAAMLVIATPALAQLGIRAGIGQIFQDETLYEPLPAMYQDYDDDCRTCDAFQSLVIGGDRTLYSIGLSFDVSPAVELYGDFEHSRVENTLNAFGNSTYVGVGVEFRLGCGDCDERRDMD